MMVDGAEEGQFRGPIDVLAPYTSSDGSRRRAEQAWTTRASRRSTEIAFGPPLSRA